MLGEISLWYWKNSNNEKEENIGPKEMKGYFG
jgi:hypothetical protein